LKLASLMSLLGTAAVLLLVDARSPAQPGNPGKDGAAEVNVVLRISRKLLTELTTKRFQNADPVHLCVLDSDIVGTAWTDALFSIQFDSSAKESAFVLELKGSTFSKTVSEQPLVEVFGSAQLNFNVRKRVTFDGMKYHSNPSEVDAVFNSQVDDIVTPHGLIGWIIKLIAAKKVRQRQPLVAAVAFDDAKSKLVERFDLETARLIDGLNQVSPLQETVKVLYPETNDWIFYLSTTPTHLIVGFGPRNRRLPELPVTEKTNAPIEMWIRSKEETQAMLRIFQIWKSAGKQLDTMLPPDLAKAIKPGDNFKTQFVKEWVVIQLGVGGTTNEKQSSEIARNLVVWRPTTLGTGRSISPEPAIPVQPSVRAEAPSSSAPIIWRPAEGAGAAFRKDGDAGVSSFQVEWRAAQPRGGPDLPLTPQEQKPLFAPRRK
jgi:hypothetical protein